VGAGKNLRKHGFTGIAEFEGSIDFAEQKGAKRLISYQKRGFW
jgi:hypothetical protein